ncbi:MAG: TetR family transcriptional regulator [Acidobacteria bacterium]|nr:TetR family transcriptional regulator [Acidobacteriota bacterium]
MLTSARNPQVESRRANGAALGEARYDQQLAKILDHATEVFCEKGYEGASMRDIARSTGMSLAGMYHYFGTKERLLYLIQKLSFGQIRKRLDQRISQADGPEQRIRAFIANHLEYFLEHQHAMKVLSHEDDVLTAVYGREVAELKRDYYRICCNLVEDYKKEKKLDFDSRTAVLALFGMMNWIYTWYNPRLDGDAGRLAREMGNIFFGGIANCSRANGRRRRVNLRQHRMPSRAGRGSGDALSFL